MKKQLLKRITALGMVAALSCGMIAVPETFSGLKDTVAITASAEDDIANGTLGNMTWRINSVGTLFISLEGAFDTRVIPDFTQGGAPWYSYRDTIKKIILPSALRGIGDNAFYNLQNLALVRNASGASCFPVNLRYIGKYAFGNCKKLKGTTGTTLKFGDASGMTGNLTIKQFAFGNCFQIEKIDIKSNYSVTVNEHAFSKMNALKNVDLDTPTLTLGYRTFYNCNALETVRLDINATVDADAFYGTEYAAYAQAVSDSSSAAAQAAKFGALVNKERANRGYAPLKYCSQVAAAAQLLTDEYCPLQTIHPPVNRPDGRPQATVLEDCGFDLNNTGKKITLCCYFHEYNALPQPQQWSDRWWMNERDFEYCGCGFSAGTSVDYWAYIPIQPATSCNITLNGYVVIAR